MTENDREILKQIVALASQVEVLSRRLSDIDAWHDFVGECSWNDECGGIRAAAEYLMKEENEAP